MCIRDFFNDKCRIAQIDSIACLIGRHRRVVVID